MERNSTEPIRRRDLFDAGWGFHWGDLANGQSIELDDSGWRELDLPHDWSIEGPFSEDHPSGAGGGYLPGGIGWYRKAFRVNEQDQDRRVYIEFDGVYKDCDVWINEQHLGFHPYGYTSFYYDLTPYLHYGQESNVLAVRVDDSTQPDSRWYSGAGIYRHVWLLSTNSLHVAHWGTFVRTPFISDEFARVEVLTKVRNDAASTVECKVTTTIVDRDNNVIAAQTTSWSHGIFPDQEHEFVQSIYLPQPRRWTLDDPHLYKVMTKVEQGGIAVDDYVTPLGIREFCFDAKRGFSLNGQHVKLNGTCLHREAGCVGAAVPERVLERRLEILKEMGCNSIRCSHYPPAPEMLDMCDRMGFLVMDEAFDEWRQGKYTYGYHDCFDEWSIVDLRSMIFRDRNHPSIVMWSVGNEIPEQTRPEGIAILRKLVEIVHEEDPTRPVTVASNAIGRFVPTLTEFCDLLDVVGYNYVDRFGKLRELYYGPDHERYPDRKILGTEHQAIGGIRGDFVHEDVWFRGRYNTRMLKAEQLWKFTSVHDYVAGDYMWTAFDYLGESPWPHKNASCGVLDTCGFPKDGYFFYLSQWTKKPMAHLVPHWNWPGHEGEIMPVVCYTNCESVELFLNDRSFGVKRYVFPRVGMTRLDYQTVVREPTIYTTTDLHLTWDVPYEPGTLRAVGRNGDEIVCIDEAVTAGEPSAISLSADRHTINADGRDVVHITVRILDQDGNLVPVADNTVEFEVEGCGKLIGVDNGNPTSHEDFQASYRKAFFGLCLAIVRASTVPGPIQITATSDGLRSDSVAVTAEAISV